MNQQSEETEKRHKHCGHRAAMEKPRKQAYPTSSSLATQRCKHHSSSSAWCVHRTTHSAFLLAYRTGEAS